jgi:hypothetical protein
MKFQRRRYFLEISQSDTRMSSLVVSIYIVWFSLRIAHFVPILFHTWPPQVILVSDWLIFNFFSPLIPIGQMNRILVESIYGRSSVQIVHFVLTH